MDDLYEWPCQQLFGGTGASIYSNIDGMCKHEECNPKHCEQEIRSMQYEIDAIKDHEPLTTEEMKVEYDYK